MHRLLAIGMRDPSSIRRGLLIPPFLTDAYVACHTWAPDIHGHNMTPMDTMRFHEDNTFSSDHYSGGMDKCRLIACTFPWIYHRIYGFLLNLWRNIPLIYYHLRLYISHLLLLLIVPPGYYSLPLILYYRLNK